MPFVLAEQGYNIDNDMISGDENALSNTADDRLNMVIPAIFVILTIIAFMLDFGVIGVGAGCVFGLAVCKLIGLITISPFSLISLIIMVVIIIIKVSR